jgi:hypothetical protein
VGFDMFRCFRPAAKKDGRGAEMLVLDALRSGVRFQKFVAEAALKVDTVTDCRNFCVH